jgi:hypothetical protein
MSEYLKYRAKLAKLFSQKEAIRNSYADDIRKAQKAKKSQDDIKSLESSSYFEESMVDEEISLLATDYLIGKATRRFVPIPSRETEGMWNQCNNISDRYILTRQGISELRSSLRKEQKEKIELVVMILAVLTGIIGAVTGLVAVIMK